MFAAATKAVVRTLGAQGDLISNGNVNDKLETLTLVRVRKRKFWPLVKLTITDQTLLELMEEADVSPEHTEEVLTQDFTNLSGSRAAARAKASAGVLDPGGLQLSVDTVDRASSFTLKKKTVDVGKLRKSCANRKVRRTMVDMLRLKDTDQLTFVYQTVYNTSPVTFRHRCQKDGSVSAGLKRILNIRFLSFQKTETSFTIPEGSTFAYGLMEVTADHGILGIPPRTRKVTKYNHDMVNMVSDSEDSYQTLQQVHREVKMKERVLQPLQDLLESTRRDLLKALAELLEDGRALTLLEQTLDQDSTGPCDRPHPQAVSSFMTLLEASDASTSQKDALHLLVSAMDSLPEDVPAHLTHCAPNALRVLDQLVDSLKDNGGTTLPESLPPPLQEDGGLRWAAELLCCSGGMLAELSEQWDRPELPPGVLLEVLSVTVRGLSLMLPTNLT